MTINSEPTVFMGPEDPLHPLSEKRLLAEALGSQGTVQEYEDGTLYEAKVRKGATFAGLMHILAIIGDGHVTDMWDPADTGDMDNPYFIVGVWVPKEVK